MDPFFAELGRTVAARWKAQNFSLAEFPEIAVQALEARPPAQHVDVSALVRDFLLNDEQPFQSQSGFGQPELIVYDDPRFYIQILFWLEGTTDIHQHMFSGAFHVLQGSSIHSHFDFENAKPISAHLRVGDLRMRDTRLLETGSTAKIVSGPGFIHSLFHLEMPSLTVVVRTHTDPGTGPQFTYLPPHMAVDPFLDDALTMRRKQLFDALEKTGDPAYVDLTLEALANLDFERGFFILQNGMGHLRNLGAWEEAVETFQRRHGALADSVAPTLEEIVRRDGLVEFRSSITDPELRFFLALLLNVPSRADLLALVGQRFPESPIDTVARWAEDLLQQTDVGVWLLDAEFPADLPVEESDQPELFLAALRCFMEGGKPAAALKQFALPKGGVERLREAFVQSSLRALVG